MIYKPSLALCNGSDLYLFLCFKQGENNVWNTSSANETYRAIWSTFCWPTTYFSQGEKDSGSLLIPS